MLCKQDGSIAAAPLPLLVNLGSRLTEQKLICSRVVFVYPPPGGGPLNQRSHPLILFISSVTLAEEETFPKKFSNAGKNALFPPWLFPGHGFCFPCVLAVLHLPLFTVRPRPFTRLSLHRGCPSVFLPGLSFSLIRFLWASCTSYQSESLLSLH